MIRKKIISLAISGLLVGTVAATEKQMPDNDGHQVAIAALGNMSAYLRSLEKFNVSANISKDEVLEDGQKLQFDSVLALTANRPNQLFAEVSSGADKKQYFYDGKHFTIYTPILNFYASFDAPETIGKTIQLAQDKFDISFPLADLFRWGTDAADFDAIDSAKIIGIGRVNGISCNHFAYTQKDVDWQICIKRGGNPLPLKLVITTKTEVEQPQYVATMTWDTAPVVAGTRFTFSPDKDDQKIHFGSGEK